MEIKINLYGASGHCKVIIDTLLCLNHSIEKIYDDDENKKQLLSYPINPTSTIANSTKENFIISIGNNRVREQLSKKLNVKYTKLIHPRATLSRFSFIGEGTVVMAGALINADSKIGKHCIINSASVIEHDCKIEDYVHISPNASLAGNVSVGQGSQIGIGAVIKQEVTIGKWVVVGAGAVVVNDIPDFAVVVGNPARILKYNTPENE